MTVAAVAGEACSKGGSSLAASVDSAPGSLVAARYAAVRVTMKEDSAALLTGFIALGVAVNHGLCHGASLLAAPFDRLADTAAGLSPAVGEAASGVAALGRVASHQAVVWQRPWPARLWPFRYACICMGCQCGHASSQAVRSLCLG